MAAIKNTEIAKLGNDERTQKVKELRTRKRRKKK